MNVFEQLWKEAQDTYWEYDPDAQGWFYHTPKCAVCRVRSKIPMTEAQVAMHMDRQPVQLVFPEKNADEREVVISGTHPACWESLFADDEEA